MNVCISDPTKVMEKNKVKEVLTKAQKPKREKISMKKIFLFYDKKARKFKDKGYKKS
jgi:hypothetical protein